MKALKLVNTNAITKEEWLDYRRKGLTGTDIAAIAGLNKWKSPVGVYLDKTGQAPEIEDNDAMYFGRLFEDVIAKEFTRRTGKRAERRNFMLQHPSEKWALANIDRLILDKENGNGILEVKTASEYLKGDWEGEEVPAPYLLQLQWYLYVTGLDYGYFATLLGGNKFIIRHIKRDEELINYLVSLTKDFWINHVLAEVPPVFDGSDASSELLKALYPQAEPLSEINLSNDVEQMLDAMDQLVEDIKIAEKQKKEYENQIKNIMGENEKGNTLNRVVFWKNYESNRIDSKRLKVEQPDLYKKYTNTTTARRFTVK